MPLTELAGLLALGLGAGVLGGMLGLGGSLVIIPALTLLLGRDQHVSQAAAMIVNLFIAIPSMLHHRRMGAVDPKVLKAMLPVALALMVAGVALSNQFDGMTLRRVFGAFLVYVVFLSLARAYRAARHAMGAAAAPADQGRVTPLRAGSIGGLTGFLGGLLGIGGGGITVPLLQRVCGVPLLTAIGTSSAVMVYTAAVGATYKNLSVALRADSAAVMLEIGLIAAILVPAGILGGIIGARLAHSLATWVVHAAFAALMAWAAVLMLGG